MQELFTAAVVATITVSVACGAPDAQKRAEEAKAKAEDAVKAADGTVAGSMADLAKVMSGMTPTGPDGKPVETVSAGVLAGALPIVSGWDMAKPEGKKLTMPFPVSQAETSYKKGDSEIDVKVVDAAMAQMMMLPWSMMMASGYQKDTATGYEKAVTVNGFPGFERWNKDRRHGELNLLVNKRFMITIEGDSLSDTSVLHEFASRVNAGALK